MTDWSQLLFALVGLITALGGGVAQVIMVLRSAQAKARELPPVDPDIARVRVRLESLPVRAPEPEPSTIQRGGLGVTAVSYRAARHPPRREGPHVP